MTSDDKIAEIRARHAAPGAMLPMEALGKAIADRDFLLTEVERLTRERDEARAEVERLTAQIVVLEATGAEASDEIDRLREVIRTIRARCVELDDSDAVSEMLDISSAALEAKP